MRGSVNFIPKKRNVDSCAILFSMWEACASCLSCGVEFQMKLPLVPFFEGMGWMDSVD